MNFAAGHGEVIRRVTAQADAESIIGTPQAVRGRLVRTSDGVPVVLARTLEERNPYVPDRPMRLRVNGSERVETMPHHGTIEAAETSLAPRSYVIPLPAPQPAVPPAPQGPPFGRTRDPGARMMASVIDRLETHGVRFTRTVGETSFHGERFRIESSGTDEREFEGHKLRTLTGAWESVEVKLPEGSLVIPMDQPLARLAFMLLDPRSDDGLLAWNILDPVLGANPGPPFYPVFRTMNP